MTSSNRLEKLYKQINPPKNIQNTRMTANNNNNTPLRICVTGAAGQIAYSLLPMICQGRMLGPNQPVILHLLDIPPAENALKGVCMELQDCAFTLLKGIVATTNVQEAFTNVDICVLVGAFPRKKGMLRADLLEKNAGIFKEQGKAINDFASRNVKVLVVGNPANTNCLIAQTLAPSIPAKNFSALTRLDHNRARGLIGNKLNADVSDVSNVVIWGNHSATQYPDVSRGVVFNHPSKGVTTPVKAAVNDPQYVQTEFIQTVQQRGAAVIKARGLSSAMSAANAVCDHIHDWFNGTKREGELISMAVCSDGSYGIKKGLIFSFPVLCKGNFEYEIVQGLEIDDFSREKLNITEKELTEEMESSFKFLGIQV